MDDRRSELGPWLERIGLFLLLFHLALRFTAATSLTEYSADLLIHSLVWIGAAVWLAGKAMGGGAVLRWTGLELPFFLWIVLCIASVLVSSYRLPAVKHAFVFCTLPLLFWWIVSAVGNERRLWLLQILFSAVFVISLYAVLQIVWVLPVVREQFLPAMQTGEINRLAIRLQGSEAWSTFVYPNSLAAFLVLAIPIVAGSLVDARRAGSKPFLLGLKAATLALAVAALCLTGSLGGWVAFAAAAAAFGALMLARRSAAWKKRVCLSSLGVVLLIAILAAAGPLSPSSLGKHSVSMEVRSAYWEGAAKIAADHPLLGVGLDNFQEYYPEYKPEAQHFSRKAHNDYLQISAETGFVGLLIFLLMMLLLSRAALSPTIREQSPPQETELGRKLTMGAAMAGFVAAYFLSGVFLPLVGATLIVVWAVYLLLSHTDEAKVAEGPMDFLRIGAGAGFVGFCVHMLADYDLYDFGAATALFLVAALQVVLQREPIRYRVGRAPAGVAAALLTLVAAPVLLLLVPSLTRAENSLQLGEEALAAGRHDEAERLFREGIEATGQDARLHRGLVAVHAAKLSPGRWKEGILLQELRSAEWMGPKTLEDWRNVRRRDPGMWDARARLDLSLALAYLDMQRRQADPTGLHLARYRTLLSDAASSAHRAVKLYPTYSRFRYLLAFLLDQRQLPEAAKKEYERALGFSAEAARLNQPSMALPPYDEAHALVRLGRAPEAAAPLERHVRGILSREEKRRERPFTPSERAAFLEAMRRDPRVRVHEWYDSAMNETLEEVLRRFGG